MYIQTHTYVATLHKLVDIRTYGNAQESFSGQLTLENNSSRMHVCMCVCVCVCVCLSVCLFVCLCSPTFTVPGGGEVVGGGVCLSVCLSVFAYLHSSRRWRGSRWRCVYVCVCICLCSHTFTVPSGGQVVGGGGARQAVRTDDVTVGIHGSGSRTRTTIRVTSYERQTQKYTYSFRVLCKQEIYN